METKKKHPYSAPNVERIRLDNEISLILQSPPGDPEDEGFLMQEHFNNDPFKTDKA